MKKIIAAMLSAMVGLFGYTLVDTAIETRVSELESRVAELEAYHEYSDVTPDEPTTKPTTKPSVPQPTDELKKIVEDIYANTTAINFEVDRARDLDLSYPKDVKEFSGLDSADEIHSAVYSESDDYELLRFLCIIKVKNPASVENLKTEMLEGLDCIKSSEDISEKALVASHNNIILTVMASETIADDIYNAFNIVTGNSASAPLSKYGISGSGKCGDYATWELTPDGTLTISGRGDMYDYDPEWNTYKNYIKEVIIADEITSIGDQAFENCVNLTAINIPDGVTSIGYCAFMDCSSLTSITLPDSVTTIEWDAFRGCSSLESINIPYGVKEIQADAFADCSSLANVIIPDGVTRISNPAMEPEIRELQNFINAMGGKVSGAGTKLIEIEGVKKLHGAEYTVACDRIVCATYLFGAAATKGKVELSGVLRSDIEAVLSVLSEMGCDVIAGNERIFLDARDGISGVRRVRTQVFPGFPTDAQAPLTACLCVADGTSLVQEEIFESRFRHIGELMKMGADIRVDNRVAVICGVPHLCGAEVYASDLRGAGALCVAGLAAEGVTTVYGTEYSDRGYEKPEYALGMLGADIKREG